MMSSEEALYSYDVRAMLIDERDWCPTLTDDERFRCLQASLECAEPTVLKWAAQRLDMMAAEY